MIEAEIPFSITGESAVDSAVKHVMTTVSGAVYKKKPGVNCSRTCNGSLVSETNLERRVQRM